MGRDYFYPRRLVVNHGREQNNDPDGNDLACNNQVRAAGSKPIYGVLQDCRQSGKSGVLRTPIPVISRTLLGYCPE